MGQINAKIDDQIVKEFRDVIYAKRGLKKGDFKDTLEDAMLEYILKYSKNDEAKNFVKEIRGKRKKTD